MALDAKTLVARMGQSFVQDDPGVQEAVVEEAMAFFLETDAAQSGQDGPPHIFCKSQDAATVVAFLVVILAGFEVDFAADQFTGIRDSLEGCDECLLAYHSARAALRVRFLTEKHVRYDSMEKTLNVPARWMADSLLDTLNAALANKDDTEALPVVVSKILIRCLVHPRLLRLNQNLKVYFHGCFKFLMSAHEKLSPLCKLYPGLLYLLFEGSAEERDWALARLYSYEGPFGPEHVSPLFQEEFEFHAYNIQNPDFYDDKKAVVFWANVIPLLKLSTKEGAAALFSIPTKESYKEYSTFRILDIPNLFVHHIFSYPNKPLPILLRFLSALLHTFKGGAFDLIKPHNYRSFLDMTFKNPAYVGYLDTLPSDVLPTAGADADASLVPAFIDLFEWMKQCNDALAGPDACQFVIAIFGFLLNHIQNKNCGAFVGIYAMNMVTSELKLSATVSKDLEAEINYKAIARSVLDKKSIVVFDNLLAPHLAVSASHLIATAIAFDITALSFQSNALSLGQPLNFHWEWKTLWELMAAKLPALGNSNPALIKQFFAVLCAGDNRINKIYALDILYFKTKIQSGVGFIKATNNIKVSDAELNEIIAACNSHKKVTKEFVDSLSLFFNRLSQHLSHATLTTLLIDKTVSKAIWCCIFSPQTALYDATMGFMCESLDVDGRQEIVSACFNLPGFDPNSFLVSLAHAIDGLTSVGIHVYTGVRRGVKILMDLVQALFDPVTGIIVDGKLSNKAILTFWDAGWRFLGSIFKNIFEWSVNYEKIKARLGNNPEHASKISADLLDFTRDVLDLSTAFVNGVKVINAVVKIESTDDSTELTKALLDPILPTLWDLFKWLRLSDTALLVLCVNLIKRLFDICAECNVKFNKELLEILIRLCMKNAKKSNNKMSAEQRGELLIKARVMDEKLVEIMSQATVSPSPQPQISTSTVKLESGLSYTPRNKQSNLSDYLKSNVKREVIDLTVPKRLSALEEAKLKLAQKRVIKVAPARPDGYNRKKDSDSDSDSDREEGAGLFTKEQVLEKMKKSKMALQSLQGPKFNISGQETAKQQKIKQKKKEEELMRLRLNVDMNPLYVNVLKWDYNVINDLPNDQSILDRCRKVKEEFDSPEDYQNSFEPLLLLECWQSIQRSKQLASETPFRVTLGSRSATDTFYDVYASINKALFTENRYINDSDLVVLMLVDGLIPNETSVPKHMAMQCKINCLAKVREIKSSNKMFSDITFRVSANSRSFLNKVSPQMEIVVMKVMPMTTIEREFSSLKGLPYYNLATDIVKAEPGPLYKPPPAKIQEIKTIYDVNDSQAQAISGTVHGEGFSLIQGPPGTGKTKTILGVIGYFLTSAAVGVHQVMTPGTVQNGSTPKRKILICAPSNAAVDELVLRIRKGIKNSKGQTFTPTVVRLGKSDAINEQVKDLTLEEQVDKQLSVTAAIQSDDSKIREEHRRCVLERDELKAKLDNPKLSESEVVELEMKLQQLMSKRRELGKRLDEAREQRAVKFRNREIERRNLQFKILNEAQVVCSTLSGSAHDVLARMSMTFDTVVIDEAAQCIELSAIIPLRYGCKKCIMVGDPNQLPPTVLSQKAASYNYEQSLFVRMQTNHKDSIYLLNTQYRMHPEISQFPSREFYKSKLLDGDGMAQINERPWHQMENYGPYKFFQIDGSQAKNSRTMSLYNTTEAQLSLEIVKDLFRRFPKVNWKGKIGIISPYKEQIRVLQNVFFKEFGQSINLEVDFNTVDGFQGQEKDIIIFSCVRAEANQGVGFLADVRRMNVALTRARASLWILGSTDTLLSNKTWKDLINDAQSRDLVKHVKLGFTRSGTQATPPKVTSGVLPKPKRPQIEELEYGPTEKKQKTSAKQSTKKKANTRDKEPEPASQSAGPPRATKTGYIKPIDVMDSRQIPTLPRNTSNWKSGGLDSIQNGPPQLIKISKKLPPGPRKKRT